MDCIDNMWEEEEEQIWECRRSDFVLERLRNQPFYSPPPSPSSVFLISPQLYFSLPPPLTPQLHFSPPPPPPRFFIIGFIFQEYVIDLEYTYGLSSIWTSAPYPGHLELVTILEVAIYGCHYIEILDLRIQSNRNTRSSPRFVEDSLRGFCSTDTVEVSLKYLNELKRRRLLKRKSEKMRQLLTYSRELISQVEERSVEIPLEVDATNSGAHVVKAYENFPIVSHSEKKNTRDKLKRNYKSISVLTLEDLQQHFGSKLESVAKSFGVGKSTLKRKCRRHEISRWPFQPERKKERLMEVISPSMDEKHDSRLQCIRTPLHARSSPRTIALLDGGEMVQLDSSKQQSLVEFDVTNNSAHLVRASQSCSTVSHLDETNSRETLNRKCPTASVLSFEDLQQHFGCRLDDAAKALGVSVSTVKRTCRQHGIPRWPSRKKKKVALDSIIKTHYEGETDVSPTYNKMPTDGQTERGNEMVGHLQDQNEGLNLSNTENDSHEESITTHIFQDSIPVFERDCILLEPQGEKNVSTTHKTPTNGQIEVENGMIGHSQDQNGIVLEFIEGPNLLNTENCSNEKSLTIANFQDSVPSNYPTMDFSISSTYREIAEAGGFSELAFQLNELTPSTTYPNPNACVFT
ncbi:unnamed protein product [Camellia sinensis]